MAGGHFRLAACALAAAFAGPACVALTDAPAAIASSGNLTQANPQTALFSGLGTFVSPLDAGCSEAPTIEQQPTDRTVTAPGTAEFTASASTPASCEPPTVQWYSEAPGASTPSPITGATFDSYATPATTTEQSGTKLEAIFRNEFNETTTEVVTLTVEPALCSAKPAIEEQPTSDTVTAPNMATFNASASTPENCGPPTIDWQVSSDDGASWSNASSSPTLSINPTNTSQSGDEFRAVFTNDAGSTDSNPATLTVEPAACSAKPGIEQQPTSHTVTAPAAATFTAAASKPENCQAPTVQWFSKPPGGSIALIAGATSTSYTTGPTNANESGTKFEAVFTNAAGETTTEVVTLTVNQPPCSGRPVIELQPTSQSVTAPATATFTASASTPENCQAPTVQWLSQAPGASSASPIGGATSDSYTTLATNTTQSGTKLEAVFKNGAGETTSEVVTLTVSPPPCSVKPVIEQQPTGHTVTAPAAATFTAAASKPENCQAPTVQWFSQAPGGSIAPIAGATSTSYGTGPTNASENGTKFEAVFTNAAGETTTEVVTLTVNPAAPTLTAIEPISGPAAGGASVTIKGTGFGPSNGTNAVTFGGATASVTAANASSLTVTTPAHSSGAVTVAVTNTADGLGASAPSAYTYIAPSTVTISGPPAESNDATPSFSGTTSSNAAAVAVHIFSGSTQVAELKASPGGGKWAGSSPSLGDGAYSAEATQETEAGNTGTSNIVTFTIDTAPPVVTLNPIASPTNNSKPTFSGNAGNATGDIASVTLRIYSGTSASGSPVQTGKVTPSGTTWSAGAETLPEGTYTAQAEQSDKAGNAGRSTPTTFTVKTKGPVVTLTPIVSPSNDATPSFGGGAGVVSGDIPSVTLKIYAGEGVLGMPIATVEVFPSGAKWSTLLGPLSDGTYTAQAEQSDEAGNIGKSATSIFAIDTAAPAVTLTSIPSPTNDSTPTFSGGAGVAAGDNSSVTLKIYSGSAVAGSPIRTGVATPSGNTWKATLSGAEALPEGTYTAQAEQSDKAGNVGHSSTSVFTVKTQGPALSLSALPSLSNNSKPSFGGGAGNAAGDISSVTLKIYSGGSASGTPLRTLKVAPGGNTWGVGLTEGLNDGTYTAQAEQSDEAGNTTKSTPSTFTVDTTSPVVTLVPLATLTNDTTPSFSGDAGNASGDSPAVTLKIYSGEAVSGSPIRTVAVAPSGTTWKATLGGAEALPEGTYTAVAEQSDKAGNIGRSDQSTFTVVTTAPVVSLNSVAAFTKDTTPSFSGDAADGAVDIASVTLNIYSGTSASGSPIQTLTVKPSGATWATTLSKALSDGAYTAQAEQSDKAGNTSRSTPATFTVDTSPPAVSLTPLAALTNDSTPSFSGAAGVAPGDIASVIVKIYAGSSASGTPVRTLQVTPGGSTWSAGLTEPLTEGTYTAQAEQSDQAGNTTKTASSTFALDIAGPAVTLTSVSAFVNQSPATFGGAAGTASSDIASVTLKIYSGEGVSGSPVRTVVVTPSGAKWSTGLTEPLVPGAYTAQAEQSDKAGNTARSTPSTFTIKTTGPAVSLTPIVSPTNITKPSLSGAAGVAPGDIATVTVKIYSGSSASGTPVQTVVATPSAATWKATPTEALKDGNYTAQAEQSDKAGNTTKSTPSTFTVDTTPPAVSITKPSGEVTVSRPTFSGVAGTAVGDLSTVTLKIFTGTLVSGTPTQTVTIIANGAKWTTGSSGPQLADGTYTAEAEQSDGAGNIGSNTSTFTIKTNSPLVALDTSGFVTRGKKLFTGTTPSFTGSASAGREDNPTVQLKIFSGTSTSGNEPVQTVRGTLVGTTWAIGPVAALAQGTYTAQAEQEDSSFGATTGVSPAVTFIVDTTPPQITLTSPANGSATGASSQLVTGAAGTAEGDLPEVTVQLFSGSTIGEGQAPLQSVKVPAAGGTWSTTLAGLSPGAYSVRADQYDDVGNLGVSASATFEVVAAGPAARQAAPPAASFTWFPAAPHAGESVSLVSSSTDASAPITRFAWDRLGSGVFTTGGQVITTTFATPGNHLVRLNVTAANGLSSTAAETIPVSVPTLTLMRPFPIVRITSTDTASGVIVHLLRVKAVAGARVTVTCKGRGCPIKSARRVTVSRKGKVAPVEFRKFERSLRAGVTLEIRVYKAGMIGKYTRFVVRSGRLPLRDDECLSLGGVRPMTCPS